MPTTTTRGKKLPDAQPDEAAAVRRESSSDRRPDEQLLTADLYAQLETHLLALSPDERLLLTMRYSEQLPFSELATIFGRPQSVLKMRVHRALKKLRELFDTPVTGDGRPSAKEPK